MNKVIRTICLFRKIAQPIDIEILVELAEKLTKVGYEIQTTRLCSPDSSFTTLERKVNNPNIYLSLGQLEFEKATYLLDDFYRSGNVSFNVELAKTKIEIAHADLLFKIIENAPKKTFNFTYTFNNPASSPYFPSARYEKDGFAIGLQPTNLTKDANSLNEWFNNMKNTWDEINETMQTEVDYLGIDSSIAPLFKDESSLISFVKKLGYTFSESTLTNTYIKITKFIKEQNPKPVGLNGIMFPALEDFELAEEYENGNFTLERNIYLSLHSGLGIDTYPMGVNESKQKILDTLKLMQGLSNKYQKPLSVRFVSDGKAKIGEMTNFQNQFLKDVVIRSIGN